MAINRTTIAKLLSSQSRTRHPARSNRQSSRSQSAKTPSNQQQKRERRERSGSSSRQSQLAQIALYTRIAAAAITIIVLGTIAGVQYAERDQIRSGVHAFGVDLGGMTEDEARAALEEATAERRNQPLRLTDGSRRWELSAGDLGLTMDVDRALADALAAGHEGRGASRLAILWHMRSSKHEVGLESIAVQGPLLDAAIEDLAADIFQEKVDPVLSLNGGEVHYVEAVVGRELDVHATRDDIVAALATGEPVLPLTIQETQPSAYDEDYAEARRQLTVALDAPVELVAADEVWTLEPQHIASRMTIHQAENGQPGRVEIDESWVDAVVWEITVDTDRLPQSARIWWDASGALVKTADGAPGKELDRVGARQMVLDAFLGRSEANRVDLPVAITNPPALPSDLGTLGISSKIAEASTEYGGGLPERMHNIELAARLLNGVVVLPGQTFSFNAEIGEMTTDAGFQIGYGIAEEDGEVKTIPAEAGGICQVATTVFQPVFWTGYQIDQRSTHSYWIPGYTYNGYVGLDATVEPSVGLDFKWTNNSSTAVLIEASTDGQNFTVALYGSPPSWRVEIDPPVIENRVDAKQETVYEASSTIPEGTLRRIERAQDGFDVKVERRVFDGDNVDTLVLSAKYEPSRNVVLVGSETGELPADFVPPES